jgi:hypothetical protein
MGFVIGVMIVSGLVIAIGFAPAKKDYRTLSCDFDQKGTPNDHP